MLVILRKCKVFHRTTCGKQGLHSPRTMTMSSVQGPKTVVTFLLSASDGSLPAGVDQHWVHLHEAA